MADGPILVTGAAGFVGFHVAKRLSRDGRDVVGLDNMNAYYDPALKEARRMDLAKSNLVRFVKLDLADRDGMAALFKEHRFPYGSPRGAGWRSIFARRSIRLCGRKLNRFHHHS
jgi:UDP-glucuronate 4-epimerase